MTSAFASSAWATLLCRGLSPVTARTRTSVSAVIFIACRPSPVFGDFVDFLKRQGWTVLPLQKAEDIRDLAGRPHALHLDPAIGKLVDRNFLARVHPQVLQEILAQRDLPFGGDGERTHGMASYGCHECKAKVPYHQERAWTRWRCTSASVARIERSEIRALRYGNAAPRFRRRSTRAAPNRRSSACRRFSAADLAGHHRAEQFPALAVEAHHLHLLERRKVVRGGVDLDTRQQHAEF